MAYDKEQVAQKLIRWKNFMQGYHLPAWEELPDLELYMDQVVSLVNRYMNLHSTLDTVDPLLTPSAINNYVRLKQIPAPVKKRYSRVHLAYLVVISCLKQSMSLADIQRIMPVDMTAEQVEATYKAFLNQYNMAFQDCLTQIEKLAEPTMDPGNSSEDSVERLVLTAAVAATLYKLLTGKLLMLQLPAPEKEKS